MERRRIGSLEVSVVGLGCNNFGKRVDVSGTAKVVFAALDAGINFLDTADIYAGTKSEEYLGRALGSRRKDVVLATKFGMALDEQQRGAKPEYVRQAAEASLRRLKTDYIDLYQLHQPDPDTPIHETLTALDSLVREGKVREIGCSNFSAGQFIAAHAAVGNSAARFVSVQNEYSMLHREPEADILPVCKRLGTAFIPYFPLASGLLTGKYRRGDPAPTGVRFGPGGFSAGLYTDKNLAKVDALRSLAAKHQRGMLQMAFSWLLRHEAVSSVIAGAMTAEQVQANAGAYVGHLTHEELEEAGEILFRGD
jgi:aryl-alcohol dehydrogenase-like predicted oxidoreductase